MVDIDASAVQALLDKQAISELLMRYSRSLDRRDWDLLRSVYWPDAEDDHILYRGDAAGFFEHAEKFLIDTATMHFLGNLLIDFESDVKAFSENYFLVYHDIPSDSGRQNFILWGRYLDSLEKRGAEWRISSRTVALDAYSLTPGTAVWDGGMFAGLQTRGGAKPADPLYRLHPRKVDA